MAEGSTHSISVSLRDITLDKRLQARDGVEAATAASYAELLKDGVILPPVRIVRVADPDGAVVALPLGGHGRAARLYLVDGFHRYEAHRIAGRQEIAALIEDGTWRDCILAAASANSSHGKPRTIEDKRRALKMLLQDAVCAKMASRPLAKLCGVSHEFVNATRKDYGLQVGDALTPEVISRVDGTPAGAWAELYATLDPWEIQRCEQYRKAAGPEALATNPSWAHEKKAVALRRRELRDRGTLWMRGEMLTGGTEMERIIRQQARQMWEIADLRAALTSRELPLDMLDALYDVLRDAMTVRDGVYTWDLEKVIERHKLASTVELAEAAQKKIEVLKEKQKKKEESRKKEPWEIANEIQKITDGVEQLRRVASCEDDQVIKQLNPRDLHPSVRDGVYRHRILAGRKAETCPDPRCGGWISPNSGLCAACRCYPRNWQEAATAALTTTATLLPCSGYGLIVKAGPDRVIIDSDLVVLLAELRAAALATDPKLAALKGKLLDRLLNAAARPVPEGGLYCPRLVTGSAASVEEQEEEEPEDEQEIADWQDEGEEEMDEDGDGGEE